MINILLILLSVLTLSACNSMSTYSLQVDCTPTELRLQNSENFWVNISRYGPASQKNILIIPPTGGTNFLDRSYAKNFCIAGYQVFVLKNWDLQTETGNFDLALHQRFYERSEKAIDLTLNEIKTGSIGLLGTSVGALHSAVAASTKDRINAVFIITGGAPLSSIIVNSDQDAMVNLGVKRKQAFGFKNKNDYLSALAPQIKLEPMKLGDGFKKKKLGMVVALEDTTVPSEAQKALQNYWKPTFVIELANGHFWAIINTWLYHSDEILEFFESSLNLKR